MLSGFRRISLGLDFSTRTADSLKDMEGMRESREIVDLISVDVTEKGGLDACCHLVAQEVIHLIRFATGWIFGFRGVEG